MKRPERVAAVGVQRSRFVGKAHTGNRHRIASALGMTEETVGADVSIRLLRAANDRPYMLASS